MSRDDVLSFNRKQQKEYLSRTGISVDIQNIGKNTKQIAVKEKRSLKQVRPGVWLLTTVMDLPDGGFCNVYDLYWNPSQTNVVPKITSSNTPYSIYDNLLHDSSTIASINGAFFFLADIADSTPPDLCYNLCIRDGKVIGLPSWDQPIVYVTDQKLEMAEPKARGKVKIGNKTISWIGANSDVAKKKTSIILYNSKCSDVVKVRDPKTNIQIGILDSKNITTPKKKGIIDIIITSKEDGTLYVSKVKKGGGTHFFSGNFILQIPRDLGIQKGDSVTPLTVDGINLAEITSGITIGRKVQDRFFLEPVRRERQDARSVIAEDVRGNIHYIVFDGSKYIPGFHGVSAEMITPYFAKDRFKKAYFLDGGGSSRLIVRQNKELNVMANQFAFRKLPNGTHLWDWKFARKVASSISLRVQTH